MKDMVKDAKDLAIKMHEGMTDKYGNPYFEHLERVANRVRDMEYDMVDETSEINLYIAAAYLHDVIEDTDYLIGDIIDKFGETIAEAVKLLTRDKEETYADYVIGIKKSVFIEGKIARVVKMADLLDHLMGPTPCPPHLIKRYEKSLYSLMGRL
jgi:(p)ppGpp synthase/HD superfamily hydrolase|tara:strand:- start:125 stop:586 length:462 start_codon:yes stop_codon:yes gene_type:complete